MVITRPQCFLYLCAETFLKIREKQFASHDLANHLQLMKLNCLPNQDIIFFNLVEPMVKVSLGKVNFRDLPMIAYLSRERMVNSQEEKNFRDKNSI